MSINWSLLQPVDIAGQFQQGLERGRAMARERAVESALAGYSLDPSKPRDEKAVGVLAAYAPDRLLRLESIRKSRTEELIARQDRQRAVALGELYNQDPRGAVQEATGAGDFDLAKTFMAMDDAQRKTASARLESAAPIAYQVAKIPYEQRKAAIQSQAPILMANGWTQEEITGFDPTDEALGGLVSTALSVKDLIERDTPKTIALEPGGSLYERTGSGPIREVIRANPGGVDFGTPVDAAPPPATGALSFNAPPGTVTTSAYRDPAHNERVGGVPNSYHTRKDAQGRPMARDFVPPPGMSMAQLETEVRRANPGMEVINEGDHVHVEPRSGSGSNAPARVASKAEYDQLPKGAQYVAPDGSVRTKS